MSAVQTDRTAARLVKAGIVVMGYDLVVALVAFAGWNPAGFAIVSLLSAMVLFAVTYFAIVRPLRPNAGVWVNFTIIPWMLRHIPGWARALWIAVLIGVGVLMYTEMYTEMNSASGERNQPIDARTAAVFAVLGFYFTLSSTLIAWARLREPQPESATR